MTDILSVTDFERLYKAYYVRLYHYAYDFVGDAGASEDIVSDVFSRLWKEHASLKVDTVSSFLFVSVRNASLNYLRKQKGQTQYEKYCHAAFTEEDDTYWRDMEERIVEIRSEVDKLPEKTRFVLEQCYLEQHSYKEVAEMLGITTDGVKKHIVKAFALLRTHFHVKKKV